MIDILQRQRVETEERNRQREQEENGGEEAGGLEGEARQRQAFPSALSRRYELRVIPRTGSVESFSLRHIRSDSIGKLVSVKGMITRASDVKPHCEVCAYSCDRCGFEIFQQTAGKSFTPIRKCPTEACSSQAASMEETVYPQTRGSKFTKYQEIKLQELPNQVPIGHIPRCMNVHVTGELTRTTSPGDTVTISGVFLPTKFEGFKALRAGLTADTFLYAYQVRKTTQSTTSLVPTNPRRLLYTDFTPISPISYPRLSSIRSPTTSATRKMPRTPSWLLKSSRSHFQAIPLVV